MSMAADRRWRRGAMLAAVSIAAIAASGLPGARTSAIRLAGPAGTLTIGSLHTSATWLGVALAQSADATLDNVTFELGGITYRMPRLEFLGANLPRDGLISLFDPRSSEAAGARLARLSAREARIPEIRIEQPVPGGKQVTVYRDVVARDIVNGRIASLTSAATTFEMATERGGKAGGGSGQLVIQNLDLAFAASLYAQKAGPQPAEPRTVYASFSLDNVTLSDPAGTQIRIARATGQDFKARPSAQSLGESMRVIGEAQDLAKASPAERSKLFGALADMLESFEIGSSEATGIEIRDPKAKDQAIGRIARIAFSSTAGQRSAEARVEGLEIVSDKGAARVGAIAFTGFSLRDTLQGLKELGGRPIEKLDPAELRKLVPTMGTMRLSGLEFDGPSAKAPKAESIRFGVRDVEVTADKPVNGIPTNLRLAVNNFALAVPPDAEDDGLKALAAMGYGTLDLSLVTAASWNEPGNELVIRELSARGADMGSVVLRGVLANVGRDVFNPDSAVAAVALVGASARNLHLTIENQGLFERVIAQEARKQRKSPDELRREYGMAAAIGVPAMLGGAPAAKQLGQALARFIAKPGRLTIAATTKSPAGLGIADIVATPEPAAILDKLEISATAE